MTKCKNGWMNTSLFTTKARITGNHLESRAKLYLWDSGCPVVKSKKIPEKFKKEVEDIIKRDFAVLFHGARFSVKFVNRVHR